MILQNQKGGTLIEAIIAMIILALLITGLNTCVLSMISSNLSSKELSTATSTAYSLIEQIKRLDYNSIVSHTDTANTIYIRKYTVTTDVSQKKIDVTILWPVSTLKHKIQLSTIIAKP